MAKTFEVEIQGTTPLLQHRFREANEADPGKGTRTVHVQERDPREEARLSAYIGSDGVLFVPSDYITAALRESGSYHKQKGSRKSIKFVVPAAVRVGTDAIMLLDGNGKPTRDFEVDSRSVRIKATGGRIMRHRARLNAWSLKFTLVIQDDVLAPATVHTLLGEAGSRIGIGDFRPGCGGSFGCFQIVSWQELEASGTKGSRGRRAA